MAPRLRLRPPLRLRIASSGLRQHDAQALCPPETMRRWKFREWLKRRSRGTTRIGPSEWMPMRTKTVQAMKRTTTLTGNIQSEFQNYLRATTRLGRRSTASSPCSLSEHASPYHVDRFCFDNRLTRCSPSGAIHIYPFPLSTSSPAPRPTPHQTLSLPAHWTDTGPVQTMEWTSDGYALAVGWEKGWSVWSVGGRCLCWAVGVEGGASSARFDDKFMFGVSSLVSELCALEQEDVSLC